GAVAREDALQVRTRHGIRQVSNIQLLAHSLFSKSGRYDPSESFRVDERGSDKPRGRSGEAGQRALSFLRKLQAPVVKSTYRPGSYVSRRRKSIQLIAPTLDRKHRPPKRLCQNRSRRPVASKPTLTTPAHRNRAQTGDSE